MARSHVSRHYREAIKQMERKGIFEGMDPEKVKLAKQLVHEAVRSASSSAYMSGVLS